MKVKDRFREYGDSDLPALGSLFTRAASLDGGSRLRKQYPSDMQRRRGWVSKKDSKDSSPQESGGLYP